MTSTSLQDYFNKITDGPGVWKWEHYFPIYERHFDKFRGQEVHLLEVGVFSGGSLKMWHAYFGDQAYVYGVDIMPECGIYADDRTKIFIGDQADWGFWQDVIAQIPRLDIIIDDGGHESAQQIATFEALLPHLAPGGVYLCEDLYMSDFRSYVSDLSRGLDEYLVDPDGPTQQAAIAQLVSTGQAVPTKHLLKTNELQRDIDSIHFYPFVAVVEKRAASLDKLVCPMHGSEWQPTHLTPNTAKTP